MRHHEISQMSPWFLWFWHLGIVGLFKNVLAFFWPFVILASFLHLGILTILASLAFFAFWHLEIKKDTIKDQSCLDFGIFALSCCFLLNLIMPKCQRCQKCQNGQNAKMQKKMPKCQKAKKCQYLFKNMPTMPRCQNQRNEGDI